MPQQAQYDSTTHQWKTGREGTTTPAGPAGANYDKVGEQMFWDAFFKENNIVPPFGGGGQAFKDKHLLPFKQFRDTHQIVGGKVVLKPAPVPTPTPVPQPTPTPVPTQQGSLEDTLMRLYYNA